MSNSNNEINRHLLLCEQICESSVNKIIEKIHEINRFDDRKERETYNNYDRSSKPIVITLSTPGGVVTAGLALIDTMRTSKTPVHTEALGMVASMGIPIFISGSKRYSHEHTVFMFHDISYGMYGTAEQHERKLEMINKFLRSKVTKLVLDKTDIRQDDLVDMNETIKDWYFDTDEAIKLGVADYKLVMPRIKREDIKSGNFVVED